SGQSQPPIILGGCCMRAYCRACTSGYARSPKKARILVASRLPRPYDSTLESGAIRRQWSPCPHGQASLASRDRRTKLPVQCRRTGATNHGRNDHALPGFQAEERSMLAWALHSVVGLVSLVCYILIVVKMFQAGQTGLGVLSIITFFCLIGLFITLIWGW